MVKRKPNMDDEPVPVCIPTSLDMEHAVDLSALWREHPPTRTVDAGRGTFEYDWSAFLSGAAEQGIPAAETGRFLAMTRVHVDLGTWGKAPTSRGKGPAPKCVK